MATRIQLRRGTATEWVDANPVLADGEPGYERDTEIFKIGDGVTTWVDLEPVGSSTLVENLLLKAPLESPTFTGVVGGVTKGHVGLGSVDNTSDAAKPVSTAQAADTDAKITAQHVVDDSLYASITEPLAVKLTGAQTIAGLKNFTTAPTINGAAIGGNDVSGSIMTAPTSTTSNGTPTVAGTETRDAILGNHTFTAVAGRRYRVILDGMLSEGSVVGDRFSFNIRNGGAVTPTAASTLVASIVQVGVQTQGAAGRVPIPVAGTFVPGAGVVTLSLFAVRVVGTGISTPVGSREFYAIDMGLA